MDRSGRTCPRRKRNPRASATDAWGQIPSGSMFGQNTRATSSRKQCRERLPASVSSPSRQVVGIQSRPQLLLESINTYDRNKASVIPQKHALELILDTLQQRDTYDIFAEPVDPNKVEDYYEIIKEPMDFGTMRAKVHEGMYGSLEQFKHDVFLVTKNAMHFNSSATIYFRQARAINELAKRVFHVVESERGKFELASLGMRRESSIRRTPNNTSGSINTKFLSKGDGCSSVSTSTLMLSSETCNNRQGGAKLDGGQAYPSFTNSSTWNVVLGRKDGRKPVNRKVERNRRFSYDRYRSPFVQLDSNPFTVTTFVQHADVSYRESLLSFVKELGPRAQMVASRKLESRLQEINCSPAALDANQSGPGAASRGLFFKSETTGPIPTTETSAAAGDSHCTKSSVENVRPVVLALEHPQGNHVLESRKIRSKKSCLPSTIRLRQNRSSDGSLCQAVVDTGHQRQSNTRLLAPTPSQTPQKKPRPPPAPGFTFDMCFLKAKLDRMIVEGSAGVSKGGGSYNSRTTDINNVHNTLFSNKDLSGLCTGSLRIQSAQSYPYKQIYRGRQWSTHDKCYPQEAKFCI